MDDNDTVGEGVMHISKLLLMEPESSLNINNKSGNTVTEPEDSTTLYFDTDRNRVTYSSSITGGKTEVMTSVFDAVVAKDGGDYVSIADAFSNGKKSVFVRTGTYIETSDIIVPSGGRLIGESISKATIILAAGNSVRIHDETRETSSGNISISTGSSTVTGTGTDFVATGITTGDYILIGNKYYPVLEVFDDTNLTIEDPYRGSDIVNKNYRVHKMNVAAQIQNIVIFGSSGPGLCLTRAYHTIVEDVLLSQNSPNLLIENSGSIILRSICNQNSKSQGMVIRDTHTINMTGNEVTNNIHDGINIQGSSSNIIIESSGISNNGGSGIVIVDEADFITITDIIVTQNSEHGIITGLNSVSCTISDCNICKNAHTGITYGGSSNCATNCIIRENGQHGIVVTTQAIISGCIVMGNVGNGIEIIGDRNSIQSNNIYENMTHGIHVHGNHSIIVGNQIYDNLDVPIIIEADSNKVSLNNITGISGVIDNGTNNYILNN